MPETVPTKPYDWTYTTTYSGHNLPSTTAFDCWEPAELDNPSHSIPLAELTRQDPILFYAEIPLFEDELHDNGSSHLLVRIVSGFPCDLLLNVCLSLTLLITARDANLHIYPVTFHITSRSCIVSDIRQSNIPLFLLVSAACCTGKQWLGSTLRQSQAGMVLCPSLEFTCSG